MDIVNAVATWTGLILGISSTVLAIVTIFFTRATDNRATDINNQTITSLQKIETSVERLSQDTNGLIKAAWDKMLEPQSHSTSEPSSSLVGITDLDEKMTELRDEIQAVKEASSGQASSEAIATLQGSITDLHRDMRRGVIAGDSRSSVQSSISSRNRDTVSTLASRLESVSSAAFELCRVLLENGRPLTRSQVKALKDSTLSSAVSELIELKILRTVRYEKAGETEAEKMAYWFERGSMRSLETALSLVGRNNRRLYRRVQSQLIDVGYKVENGLEGNGELAGVKQPRLL
jgi:hypothetical protein